MASNSSTSSSDGASVGPNEGQAESGFRTWSGRSPIPWGLLGALVLGLAVETDVARHRLTIAGAENSDWSAGREASGPQCRPYQVFCFGSSVGHNALAAKVIEQRTGWRTYNLAVCWGQAAGYYFQFQRLLAAGAKPKAIIVEFHPACLTESHWNVKQLWPELLGSRELAELAWSVRDPEFLAQMLLARNLPTIQYRLQVRELVRGRINQSTRDIAKLNRDQNRLYQRNRNENQGSVVLMKTPAYRGEVAEQYERMLLGPEWKQDPYQNRYLNRLIRVARAHNVAVYWLIPPFVPQLQERRERSGLNARYSRFAQTMLKIHPNLRVLDARPCGYDASVFYDACHLDRDGATTLSGDVGEFIERARGEAASASDRWVTLPPFRPSQATVPLEDLGQSWVALGKQRKRSRQ